MLTSEVCWCVFSITIVYLSLFFLASNPLIILTEPSAAKIQNQHTERSSELQASSPVVPPGLSPGWSQDLAVMHSVAVAAPVRVLGRGEPGLMGAQSWLSDLRLYPDHALPPLFTV